MTERTWGEVKDRIGNPFPPWNNQEFQCIRYDSRGLKKNQPPIFGGKKKKEGNEGIGRTTKTKQLINRLIRGGCLGEEKRDLVLQRVQ